jgi:hypothetical protein
MDSSDYETSYFRYVRKLDGSLEPVDLARRNGRLVPRFHPSVTEPEVRSEDAETSDFQELVEEVSQNLSETERRTWLRILDGRSILDIAEEDGVSRAAVYCRIHHMIASNPYCAISTVHGVLRKKINQHS